MSRGDSLQALVDRYHYTEEVVSGSVRNQLKPVLTSLPTTLLAAVDNAIAANVALENVQVPVSPLLSDTIIGIISSLNNESIDSIDHEHHDLWNDVLATMMAQGLQVEIDYDMSADPKVAETFIIRPL